MATALQLIPRLRGYLGSFNGTAAAVATGIISMLLIIMGSRQSNHPSGHAPVEQPVTRPIGTYALRVSTPIID